MNCFLYTCLQNLTIRRLVTTREACEFFKLQKTATSINKKGQIYYTYNKKNSPIFGKNCIHIITFRNLFIAIYLKCYYYCKCRKILPNNCSPLYKLAP